MSSHPINTTEHEAERRKNAQIVDDVTVRRDDSHQCAGIKFYMPSLINQEKTHGVPQAVSPVHESGDDLIIDVQEAGRARQDPA